MNNTSLNFKSKNINIMLTSPNHKTSRIISEESENLPNLHAFKNQKIRNSILKTTQNINCQLKEIPMINDYYSKDHQNNFFLTIEKDDPNLHAISSKGFFSNLKSRGANRNSEKTELTKSLNNTNSRFYDSTYYKTAKSNFAKASFLSFSPIKNTLTNNSKGNEINNTREINDLVYGTTYSNLNTTNNNFTNKHPRNGWFSQKNITGNQMTFDYNFNPNKLKDKKAKEVSFRLTGDIKPHSLISAKKYYKDYFIKYVTKNLNGELKKQEISKEKEIFQKKYIEDEEYKQKMSFYSHSLDYNFLNKNLKMKNSKTEELNLSKEKDVLERSPNKRIFDEVKNGFKNRFAYESSKKHKEKKEIKLKSKQNGLEFSKQVDRTQNFSYLNDFLKLQAKCNNDSKTLSDKEQSMDFIKYLYKINKDMIDGYENDSIYKNVNISKSIVDFPKEEEIIELFQKMCKRSHLVETQNKE